MVSCMVVSSWLCCDVLLHTARQRPMHFSLFCLNGHETSSDKHLTVALSALLLLDFTGARGSPAVGGELFLLTAALFPGSAVLCPPTKWIKAAVSSALTSRLIPSEWGVLCSLDCFWGDYRNIPLAVRGQSGSVVASHWSCLSFTMLHSQRVRGRKYEIKACGLW